MLGEQVGERHHARGRRQHQEEEADAEGRRPRRGAIFVVAAAAEAGEQHRARDQPEEQQATGQHRRFAETVRRLDPPVDALARGEEEQPQVGGENPPLAEEVDPRRQARDAEAHVGVPAGRPQRREREP